MKVRWMCEITPKTRIASKEVNSRLVKEYVADLVKERINGLVM